MTAAGLAGSDKALYNQTLKNCLFMSFMIKQSALSELHNLYQEDMCYVQITAEHR